MPYTEDTLVFSQDLTIDNALQFIHLLTSVFDAGIPHRRKDSYTLKIRCLTGGDDLFVLIHDDLQTVPILVGTINSTTLTEHIIDISFLVGIVKGWQIELVGLVADFKLVSIAILHGVRPEQLTFYRHLIHPTGASKKRIRVWPILIDTL